MALLNPLRYRGYVYDSETGFYYLQSRYYDPTIGRFISADGLVSTGTGVIGYNMFAYCNNNPVMCSDPSGYGWADIALEAISGSADVGSKVFEFFAAKILSEVERLNDYIYIGGSVYRYIPNSLGSALTAQANTLTSLAKLSKGVSKVASVTGIGLDLISNFLDSGLDLSRKITDSIVDVGVSAGSGFIAAKIGAFFGTYSMPILGTALGTAFGIGVELLDTFTPVFDWVKDGVDWTVDSAGGLVKNGANYLVREFESAINDVYSVLCQ